MRSSPRPWGSTPGRTCSCAGRTGVRSSPRPWMLPPCGSSSSAGRFSSFAQFPAPLKGHPSPLAVAGLREGVGGNLCPQTPMLFSRSSARRTERVGSRTENPDRHRPEEQTERAPKGRGELRTHRATAQEQARPPGQTWEAQAKATRTGTSALTRKTSEAQAKAIREESLLAKGRFVCRISVSPTSLARRPRPTTAVCNQAHRGPRLRVRPRGHAGPTRGRGGADKSG